MGPAPKCRRSAFWEGPERGLNGVLCRGSQTCFGRNRDPEGARNAKQKTECRRGRKGPEAVTEQKTGYVTADTLQSKVLICVLATEGRHNRSSIEGEGPP